MQYRQFPNIHKDISILGFGCMRLPQHSDDPKDIDIPRSSAMVRKAINAGVNYIDTAWGYHGEQSEPFLAEALSEGYRDKVYLASKLPSWLIETREDMNRYLDAQLEKLNTDHIDFYMLHALDRGRWDTYCKLDVFSYLDAIKASGKVSHVGFSFHDDLQIFKEIIDAYPWDFCQIQYNLLDTEFQAGAEGLSYAYDRGIGIIVMEPLRGGSLASRIPREVQEIWDSTPVKRTPAQWALRWLWNDPRITLVLCGMSTDEQADQNIATASASQANSLTQEELQAISRVRSVYHRKIQVPCTGCNYCMPCPHGVEIPGSFAMYNDAHMFDEVDENRKKYLQMLSGREASRCTACGTCEPLCPQGIEIIASLKQVASLFES